MTTKPELIQPFKGVLPPSDKAHLVATRSYLTYSDYELKDKLSRNPFSYLHVIHPSGSLESHAGHMAPIRNAFEEFLKKGWLVQDDQPAFYVLRQSSELGVVTGILGLVPAAAAESGAVKVHEATLSEREVLFADYLAQVGLNAEPTLLAHDPNVHLQHAMDGITAERPECDFTTADGVRHALWKAAGPALERIQEAASELDALYIADGHHRVASSQRLAKAHPHHPGAQHFMTLMVPGDQLIFKGYHRLLRRVESHWDLTSCLNLIRQCPEVTCQPMGDVNRAPLAHEIHLRGSASLDLTIDLSQTELTLPEWLQERVLAPAFGIDAPRTDRRLRYLTDDEWLKLRDQDAKQDLVFVLPPLDYDALKSVADSGRFMPPKSTWIAPKLRSGLALYDFGPAV